MQYNELIFINVIAFCSYEFWSNSLNIIFNIYTRAIHIVHSAKWKFAEVKVINISVGNIKLISDSPKWIILLTWFTCAELVWSRHAAAAAPHNSLIFFFSTLAWGILATLQSHPLQFILLFFFFARKKNRGISGNTELAVITGGFHYIYSSLYYNFYRVDMMI